MHGNDLLQAHIMIPPIIYSFCSCLPNFIIYVTPGPLKSSTLLSVISTHDRNNHQYTLPLSSLHLDHFITFSTIISFIAYQCYFWIYENFQGIKGEMSNVIKLTKYKKKVFKLKID